MVSLYFPGNYQWDLAASIAVNSKGSPGEVYRLAHILQEASYSADADTWYDGWTEVATRVEARAVAQELGGSTVSAGESYAEAAMYYQVCERVLEFHDDRKLDLFQRSVRCFEKSLGYRDPRGRIVQIPYEGIHLRGYFLPAQGADAGPAPCVIWFDGFDISAEILVARVEDLCRRGMHVLVVDAPGYGWALRIQNLATRYDYERVATAVVDFLEGVPEVDHDRLGLAANSMGGYYAPRAAAYEKRIKACAAWGAMWDFHWYLQSQVSKGKISVDDPSSAPYSQALKVFGVDSMDDALELAEDFRLENVMGDLTCSLLVVHGESDRQVPVEHARLTVDRAASRDKELLIIPSGTPGEEHCQWDNIVRAQHPIFDWMAVRLSANGSTAACPPQAAISSRET